MRCQPGDIPAGDSAPRPRTWALFLATHPSQASADPQSPPPSKLSPDAHLGRPPWPRCLPGARRGLSKAPSCAASPTHCTTRGAPEHGRCSAHWHGRGDTGHRWPAYTSPDWAHQLGGHTSWGAHLHPGASTSTGMSYLATARDLFLVETLRASWICPLLLHLNMTVLAGTQYGLF